MCSEIIIVYLWINGSYPELVNQERMSSEWPNNHHTNFFPALLRYDWQREQYIFKVTVWWFYTYIYMYTCVYIVKWYYSMLINTFIIVILLFHCYSKQLVCQTIITNCFLIKRQIKLWTKVITMNILVIEYHWNLVHCMTLCKLDMEYLVNLLSFSKSKANKETICKDVSILNFT